MQGCTRPMAVEKLTRPSAKVPADPVILSVNEALASSLPSSPSPAVFLALLGEDRSAPSQRLCPEVKRCVAKNRCAGTMRTSADTLSSHACA